MSFIEVLQDCQRAGIKLVVQEGRLLAEDTDGNLSQELRSRLAENKPEIIAWLSGKSAKQDTITAQAQRDEYPLSFAQQQLWLIDQMQDGSSEYNFPSAFELNGDLDCEALQSALNIIVERHAVLRTVFRLQNDEPVQVILPVRSVPIEQLDLSSKTEDEQQDTVQQMIQEESLRAFNLAADLMLRCRLIHLNEERHVVLFTMHHIACDGWSLALLVKEFVVAYEAALARHKAKLPVLPVQYRDYAIWQRESVQGGMLALDVAYWKKQLAGIPIVHSLCLDKSRPALQQFNAERYQQKIDKPLLEKLLQLGAAHQASLFMVLQSAFALLLSRFSGDSDIVMGVPNGGRAKKELEPLIGYFINTQVLRSKIDEQQTVLQLLQQARTHILDAFAHNNVPFDHLVDVLKHPRSLAYNPLCQIKFVLQNHEVGELQLSGLQLKPAGRAEDKVHFDLDLTAVESSDTLGLSWAYKSDLFQQHSIACMAESYHCLLQQMVAQPEARLETLTGLFDTNNRQRLIDMGTGCSVVEGRGLMLPTAIAVQAARTPKAVAVRYADLALSYAELDTRANRLAQLLQEQNISKGARIGVHLSRSIELLIAQLAIMKTGAAYVPLDPRQQSERLGMMVGDAGIEVVLLHSRTMNLPVLGVDTVFVDDAASETDWLSDYPDAAPVVEIKSGDTIYVLYTSGSSGEPKGVEVRHGGVMDYCAFALKGYYRPELSGSLVATSPAFDLSLPSLYLPLLSGGCVELLPEQDELETLSQYLSGEDAPGVLLRLTPSHVEALLTLSDKDPHDAAHVFVIGGEAFEPTLAQRLQVKFPTSQIYNHYGPTETVVGCAWYDVSANLAALDSGIPIGVPMANTVLYVLDGVGRLQAPGVPGELYIGGAGVAKGYLNHVELSAEKFISNPFGVGRLYRSGDKVRWRTDGNLEFLGRMDRQIKLRGFRIEPGEIESCLQQSDLVRDAVVGVFGESDGALLVAYVVASVVGEANEKQAVLQEQLQVQLPTYMQPVVYVWLDSLPLTVNGKVDMQALPAPDLSTLRSCEYAAPQGEIEETLAELWQELLSVDKVGRNDQFFELGGHSLLAVQLVSRIRVTLGVELPLRALFTGPSLSVLAERVRTSNVSTMGHIETTDRSQPLPLSLAQQRLWFLDRFDKAASVAYHMPAALRLLGQLNVKALKATLDQVVSRHEILRTHFIEKDGIPQQQILAADTCFTLNTRDLTDLSAEQQKTTVSCLSTEDSLAPFDLSSGPLIRGQLLTLDSEEQVLLINQHHIISDGWSLGLLVKEVAALYTAFSQGEPDPLPPLEIQYADYAQWQRHCLQGDELDRQLNFWRDHLSGAPELLTLPLDKPRPAVQSHAGGNISLTLSAELTAKLRAFSQHHDVTLFMTLLSAWSVLLSRLSGQDDVVIGTPVANRQRREVENLIGFFVNTLALRVNLSDRPSVETLLAQVKEVTLSAFAHQELPFEQVVETLQPTRSLSHSPIFQTMLALNNIPEGGSLELPGLTLSRVPSAQNSTQFDLSLSLSDRGECLEAAIGYASDLIEQASIQRWAAYYVQLLEVMVIKASIPVDTLSFLSDSERQRVVKDFNASQTAYPQDVLIHELFEVQVAERPDAIAVIDGNEQLNYAELNQRANQLAHYLIDQGIQLDDRVAISMERNVNLFVALLGTLKAGAAYLPLDPKYPRERLHYLLQDAAPKYLLTQQTLKEAFSFNEIPTLELDSTTTQSLLLEQSSSNPLIAHLNITSRHLAYVIYTSGSTGQPKGVMVEHRSVVNTIKAHVAQCQLNASDRVLQFASFGFDSSVVEIFPAWSVGAAVVLRQNQVGFEQFILFLNEQRISVCDIPTAFWQLWSEYGNEQADAGINEELRMVIVSGETMEARHVQRWFANPIRQSIALLNNYGPTEATVNATAFSVAPSTLDNAQLIPIGKPLANTQIYILDAQGEPVPVGVAGEIYIGGDGVARGYLNRDELTAEHFIADPFGEKSKGRLYKTGDLGRWLQDGTIEYLGRNDYQVKIRGYRIELGEIEARLARYENIRDIVVLVREDVPGEKRLVAYLIMDENAELDVTSLRQHLSMQLPEYMIPSAFVMLDAFPLTANGKLDRKALPAANADAFSSREYEAPEGEIEQTIATLWRELLRVDKVGRHDNFFELGGHSLLAVQLVSHIRAELDVELPLQSLFANASLMALADVVSEAGVSTMGRIEQVDRAQLLPLSLAQQRLWFLDQLDKSASAAYHMQAALRLSGRLNVAALQATLNRLLARHESLRTKFVAIDGTPYQQFASEDEGFALQQQDLSHLPNEQHEDKIADITAKEVGTPFDLSTGPLIRGLLLKFHEEEHVLLIIKHHIISDGWSLNIVLRELAVLYGVFCQGGVDPRPPLAIQYADYAQWQRSWLQGDELQRQLGFWREHLAGASGLLALPLDRPRPAVQSHTGSSVPLVIAAALTEKLRTFSQHHGTTLFMTLLTAWAALLSRLSGQDDVVIGTPVANRQRHEVEDLIGFFVNTLALRVRLDESGNFVALLEQVKDTTLAAFAHQELPFEQVVEALQPERNLSHSPLAQVTFTWNNLERGEASDKPQELPDLRLAPVRRSQETTQVDMQLLLSDAGETLSGGLIYSKALFDRATIEHWAGLYQQLLESILADEMAQVDALPLLSSMERQRVLETFNETSVDYPRDARIHDLFEQQAAAQPDAIAVEYEDEYIGYRELNERANQLAHYLIAQGVGPEVRVAVCVERNAHLIVALLGILKAGGAYLPLDPDYPLDRLTWMLEDAQPEVLLTEVDIEALLPKTELPVLRLDLDLAVLARRLSRENPNREDIKANSLAYVMYTSGSSGQPKGVMVEHRNVLRLVCNNHYFEAGPDDCLAHCANPAFDAATWEVWGALLNGARLLVLPAAVVLEPAQLNQRLLTGGVTGLWLTVGLFNQYMESLQSAFASLRYLLVGGDALDPALIRQQLGRAQRPVHLVNGYGPTETTTFACTHDIQELAEGANSIPLGRPIANTRVYILDSHGAPVPIGIAGEIYIGGDGVARGYLNRDDLTVEHFLEDPFNDKANARMYKTGDLGRWLSDGTIAYLGRNDFQVKVRGFRIELGEIEVRLASYDGIRETVVLVHEDEPGDKRLVAYLVTDEDTELDVASLRQNLSAHLPEYMMPSAFVTLESLPLTANGKLDRKALPISAVDALSIREYEAPQGETEQALAELWQELLQVERIGRQDQFFELGGHSLLVVAMVERLRTLGFKAEVRGVFTAPVLCEYAATLSHDDKTNENSVPDNLIGPDTTELTPELLPLISLTQEEIDRIVEAVPGGVANIQDIYPLLPLQEGMLFHHLLETHGDTYLLRDIIAFDSRQHLDRFLEVMQQLISRHDILRTAVQWEGLASPVQVVYRDAPLAINEVTFSGEADAVDELCDLTDPRQLRLELRRAPLLAVYVGKDNKTDEWLLSLLSHHMVCDHTTLELLVTEVRALLSGQSEQLSPALPLRNVVVEARQVTQQEHEVYFQEQLGDIDTPTAPFGVTNVQVNSNELSHSGARLDLSLANQIRECARQLGVGPAVLFHVAWAQVLARCTGQSDVVFGTVLSGRLQGATGSDRTLGMFINTLPIRVSLDGDVREVLQQSYQRLVDLLAHEQAPLVLAQRCSGVPQPLPLFTSLFNYRHSVDAIEDNRSDMEGMRLLSMYEAANYPISVSVDDYGSTFAISAECIRDIDPERIVSYVLTAVTGIANAFSAEVDKSLIQLDILSRGECAQLLQTFNQTVSEYPHDSLIHELFEQQAAAQPNTIAVVYEDAHLTYGELNTRANQLAHHLIEQGIKFDDRVAICVQCSLHMVVGLLGVLKAGGAYVPLDPAYPTERLHYMLQDAKPKVTLSQQALQEQLPSYSVSVLLLDSDKFWQILSELPHANPDSQALGLNERHLAYVIYTSGSTGQPKGVMVEHRGVVNMLTAQIKACELGTDDRVLQFASIGFDSSVAELFPALSAGARVVLRPAGMGFDQFTPFLNEQGVTVVDLPTAFWQQWAQYAIEKDMELGDKLRLVIVSGETLDSHHAALWCCHPRSAHIRLLNNYGPTETTVNSTVFNVSTAELDTYSSIPIGAPLANTRIYLLDSQRQPVPIGVEGEIYIAGDGVARGYLNQDKMTAACFLTDPFSQEPDARMYKTGDLGRWLADGNILFLGRNDFQVKIRGFRIELGEIETRLTNYEGIRDFVVLAREDMPGDKRVVAYLVADEGTELDAASLRQTLSSQLPEYMLPSVFVILDALPMTVNGKLDRKALPAPEADALSTQEYEEPAGETEQTLATIWQELLNVPRVGRYDNFFELGGHSLSAVTLSVHVQERLFVTLPLKTIFTNPRVCELAEYIEQAQQVLLSDQELEGMRSELESMSDAELKEFLEG